MTKYQIPIRDWLPIVFWWVVILVSFARYSLEG